MFIYYYLIPELFFVNQKMLLPYLVDHPMTWIRGDHNHGDRFRPLTGVTGPPSKWPNSMAYNLHGVIFWGSE